MIPRFFALARLEELGKRFYDTCLARLSDAEYQAICDEQIEDLPAALAQFAKIASDLKR